MKTLDEAIQIKADAEGDLLKMPGVTGIDAGYKVVNGKQTREPIIRIYVANKEDAIQNLKLPSSIQGISVEVIERSFVLH